MVVNKGLVSVIVPVYKVERQLDSCIKALVCQTYADLEILLVEDGSPDNCGRICDQWAKKDWRIRVLHKKNQGLGMARNSGLELAKGEYVVFVDSDDSVKADYIERLYSAVCRHDADLAVAGFIRRSADGREAAYPPVEEERVVLEEEIIDQILLPVIGASPENREDVEREMCVWTNIYKRSCIEEWGLRFVSEREYVSEDIFFNMNYFIHTKRAVLIPDCLYIYSDNPGSLTNTYRPNRMEGYCGMLKNQMEFLKENQLLERAKLRLYRTFIMKTKRCILLLSRSRLSFRKAVKEGKKILGQDMLQTVLKEYPVDKCSSKKQKLLVGLMKRRAVVLLLLLYKLKDSREERH